MRTMARVGAALSLSLAAGAGAADLYAIREESPETGSSIQKSAVTWPVPINRRYGELTPEQRRMVREEYVKLAPGDEPAYPRDGMEAILGQLAKIQLRELESGLLHFAVRVDANGHPEGVAVLSSPSEAISKAVSYVLLDTAYKPATCDGKPCESDFSFKYRLESSRQRTAHDWPPVMWLAPFRPD